MSEEENDSSELVGSAKDPFCARVELEIPSALVEVLDQGTKAMEKFAVDLKHLGKIMVQKPDWKEEKKKKKVAILDDVQEGDKGN